MTRPRRIRRIGAEPSLEGALGERWVTLRLHESDVARALQRPTDTRRLALSPAEAAAALGVSRDFFDAHVVHDLRVVRRGRRRLIPVRELDRWLDQYATTALRDGQR
jgi:excisionase family DNA binding protein